MDNREIIKRKYAEAVKGLDEDMLSKPSTEWYNYVTNLPDKLKITYLIVVLDSQVFNGGFRQYFVNGYGQFAKDTIGSLIKIGANKKSELLEEALNVVKSEGDDYDFFREKLLSREITSLFATDELIEPLDKLDQLYYEDKNEVLEQLLGNYLLNA